MKEIRDFAAISIKLCSPERILELSHGEVKKPETINYRTLRPEREGLFCERIFGTTKEWECACGKFKSIRYKGVVCDRCGVEVTHFKVRRERIGHIKLATPVSHIWYYHTVPSRMGLLLDVSINNLRSVLYFERYIVLDPGETKYKKSEIITEEEYNEIIDMGGYGSFKAEMGALAVKKLLAELDIDKLAHDLRNTMREKGKKSDRRLLKRLDIVESFRDSDNKPEWMVLDVIPVIPPELRPMVQLDGGRFATSDLNDLYRRVINRNNRLKRLMSLRAPEIIIRNEKRMLQEAVDALFDNGRRKRVVKGPGNRPLKSLSDMLKGKQGRFRQNLLGKRVDYSGRSVIVVGPELQLHQCGLPKKMALELFKPFIMRRLQEQGVVQNIKSAKRKIDREDKEVWGVLEDIVREHPILLNRAPTLHRLGMQAFEPVLVEGKAIKLHPLVCRAYNADFDGDQMAVHVPLSNEAQVECWMLMLSSLNILNPANGKPIMVPTQDMVLGIHYLTKVEQGATGEGRAYARIEHIINDYEADMLTLNTAIKFRIPEGKIIRKNKSMQEQEHKGGLVDTTVGRVLFNEIFPDNYPFNNFMLTDKDLNRMIMDIYNRYGVSETARIIDKIMQTGFKYATIFGTTIGIDDIIVPEEKEELIQNAYKRIAETNQHYQRGYITDKERYGQAIDIWTGVTERITEVLFNKLEKSQDGFNSVYLMAASGARGSRLQIRQLAGMRGLMAKPSGEIIDLPIISNFREGLTVLEYFISTHGARKGLADTALKTADAGYLTRRLIDIAQNVVITEDDCQTINGITIKAIQSGESDIETLQERIIGRISLENIYYPDSRDIIVKMDEEITEEKAREIDRLGIKEVKIRSVLTCESRHGLCRKCYGRNLATNKMVPIGEAVGTIAAQSIGQPGTQLTMRTFHIGGTAHKSIEESKIQLKYPVLIEKIPKRTITVDNVIILSRRGELVVRRVYSYWKKNELKKVNKDKLNKKVAPGTKLGVYQSNDAVSKWAGTFKEVGDYYALLGEQQTIRLRIGTQLFIELGKIYDANYIIGEFDPFNEPIINEHSGILEFRDIKLPDTLRVERDEQTGNLNYQIIQSREKAIELQPRISVIRDDGKGRENYVLPFGSNLQNVIDVWVENDNLKELQTEHGNLSRIEDYAGQPWQVMKPVIKNGKIEGEPIRVKPGDILAKIPQKLSKTKDITGGLPRVAELFEARKPKDNAIVTEIDGVVEFQGIVRGKRKIVVSNDAGMEKSYFVPIGKYLTVHEGDFVKAGDSLSDGSIDPHDILKISGDTVLQDYLVNEIQEVYRLQNVGINDKHISVIIRQMMRKVAIMDVGDTNFIIGQQVDKFVFQEENQRVISEGGKPATAKPTLLGITKASLHTDSFLSAASFQETTRVLTDASIKGKIDTLEGLKENVIIGHFIPAGTGIKQYQDVELYYNKSGDMDKQLGITQEEVEKLREEERIHAEQELMEQQSVLADISEDE